MGLIKSLTTENRQRLEAIASKKRSMLGFKAFETLPATILAKHFEAEVFTAETFPNADSESIKLLSDPDKNWSAGIIRQNPLWIVHNSRHVPVRQQSNLMHEFAHIILKHKMVDRDPKTGLFQRRQQDEDEATYLGGCLQIPRHGLLWAVQKKMTVFQIALQFNSSEAMVRFRGNVNGISLGDRYRIV
ncbi:ImmA/IrrE family metallo-endopeptidase [Pleurocapsa sp. FMAR1]|uniref:ImmA/IrrE family metallo-endopeptidase n=1 Tax=Pleurocapsa sp. FMAR1 TaxID=3040204 RepID=UPI0029C9532D|nr:ImmA/IrrE family metallo-endopeptidase [Pleurocapsa sp. FMAR1]